MRLAWSRTIETDWRGCQSCGMRMCDRHSAIANQQSARSVDHGTRKPIVPLIGPRVRLPQAKDVPEFRVLEALGRAPERWHTHWPGYDGTCRCVNSMPSLGCSVCCPELAAFPTKVLHAKLCSMKRRGLIDGGGCCDSRGDWQLAKEGARLLCRGTYRGIVGCGA